MSSHYCMVKMLRGHFNESEERALLKKKKTQQSLQTKHLNGQDHRTLFLPHANTVRTPLYVYPLDTDTSLLLCFVPGERKPLHFLQTQPF